MPVPRDTTMLKPDSRKILIAMAAAEMEPKEVAKESGVPVNIVYTMRRGFYTKPKYIGAVARALHVQVTDLIEDKEGTDGGERVYQCHAETSVCAAEPESAQRAV